MKPRPPLRVAADPGAAVPGVRPSIRVWRAALILDLEESQVRQLVNAGTLAGHRVGVRGIRVYVDAVQAYQASQPTGGKKPRESAPLQRRRSVNHPAHREALAYLQSRGIALDK